MRIAVIGPQNTGKSTFIQDFLQEFSHYSSPHETYRDVIVSRGLVVNQKSSLESQKEIRNFMFGQLRHNKEYNIIFDRCMIDNFVYTNTQYEKGDPGTVANDFGGTWNTLDSIKPSRTAKHACSRA